MILILQIQLIKQLNWFKTLPWKERLPPSCLAHTAPLPLMCQYYNLSTLRENRAMELNRFFCSSDFLLVYHESQWGPYKCNCWHEESRILLQDCSFQELIGRVLQHIYTDCKANMKGKKKTEVVSLEGSWRSWFLVTGILKQSTSMKMTWNCG